jgi:uncharacterized protein YegL
LNLVTAVNISFTGANIGVVQFASSARTELPMTGDATMAHARIEAMRQINGGTAIGSGLAMAGKLFARSYPHVLILMTDGANNAGPTPIPIAAQLKTDNVQIFGIGVGSGVDQKTLEAIVTEPASSHLWRSVLVVYECENNNLLSLLSLLYTIF